MIPSLKDNYLREIDLLYKNLEAFSEDHLWDTPKGVNNSAGVLARHLYGNLNHYIGSVLMHSGFVRDRSHEFEGKPESKATILEQVKQLRSLITEYFDGLDPAVLLDRYPQDVFGFEMSINYMLVRLYGHLCYHNGQVLYLSRILRPINN